MACHSKVRIEGCLIRLKVCTNFPEDKNWCPGDRNLTAPEITCDDTRNKVRPVTGFFPSIGGLTNSAILLRTRIGCLSLAQIDCLVEEAWA